MRVLFGISYLGLRLCILSLGDHIPDCESVLGVFSFQEENVLSPPQLGVNRDSRPVKRFYPYLNAVVPAYSYHFFCQPGLRFQHPTFIGCRLRGLRSFPGHPSCILSFLQLNLVIQDQLSLGGQLYLSHVKLFALVLGLYLYILQTRLGTQTCLVRGD